MDYVLGFIFVCGVVACVISMAADADAPYARIGLAALFGAALGSLLSYCI